MRRENLMWEIRKQKNTHTLWHNQMMTVCLHLHEMNRQSSGSFAFAIKWMQCMHKFFFWMNFLFCARYFFCSLSGSMFDSHFFRNLFVWIIQLIPFISVAKWTGKERGSERTEEGRIYHLFVNTYFKRK